MMHMLHNEYYLKFSGFTIVHPIETWSNYYSQWENRCWKLRILETTGQIGQIPLLHMQFPCFSRWNVPSPQVQRWTLGESRVKFRTPCKHLVRLENLMNISWKPAEPLKTEIFVNTSWNCETRMLFCMGKQHLAELKTAHVVNASVGVKPVVWESGTLWGPVFCSVFCLFSTFF